MSSAPHSETSFNAASGDTRLVLSGTSHLNLLLSVNNIAVRSSSFGDLLREISYELRQVWANCSTRLLLYDPELGQLKVTALDFAGSNGVIQEGFLVPLRGTPEGWVYSRREPLIVEHLTTSRFPSPATKNLTSDGVQSMCIAPLKCRDRMLGVFSVGSRRQRAFAEHDLSLLGQISQPISVAVENGLNFIRISELNERLAREKQVIEAQISDTVSKEGLIGESPEIRKVAQAVAKVASFDTTVLISGETGSGKEVVARAIHRMSSRHNRPFIKVDCASIPLGLLECELFGHERGAFTHAYTSRIGRLDMADEGTIFLDEIGDLPLDLEPKLLRVLQDHEFERVGGGKAIQVNVRVIAATSRNLSQLVEEDGFRRDLYYRLNVFPIHVPPLRDRRRDIELLLDHFFKKFALKMNKHFDRIDQNALQLLKAWRWPGNVRELENFVERAVILSPGPLLEFPPLESTENQHRADRLEASNIIADGDEEKGVILRALGESNWVVGTSCGAAARLGMKRTTLHSKMKRLGIVRRRDDHAEL